MTKETIDITETHLANEEIGAQCMKLMKHGHKVVVKLNSEEQLKVLGEKVHPLVLKVLKNKYGYHQIDWANG